jgi:hypothetical protein
MPRQIAWKRKLREMAHRSVKELVGAGSEHIEVAVTPDEDGDLVLHSFDRREGWKAKRPRLLANAGNPHGYKLLELMEQILDELHEDSGHAGSVLQ